MTNILRNAKLRQCINFNNQKIITLQKKIILDLPNRRKATPIAGSRHLWKARRRLWKACRHFCQIVAFGRLLRRLHKHERRCRL